MLDLTQKPKFYSDIQGSVTNIHPVVVIKTNPEIYLSQNEEVLNLGSEKTYFKMLNLKIPSIKESIDLESRNIKVNNITITLSNKDSFSDFFGTQNFLNVNVEIYYKSQSCTDLDDCLLVYRATIKRVNHDYDNVKIILEDLTESVMHKEVPSARIEPHNALKDSDINKIIPMTFGDVQKAPCILYKDDNLDTDRQKKIYCLPDRFNMPVALSSYYSEDNLNTHNYATQEDSDYASNLYMYSGTYLKCLKSFYINNNGDEGVVPEDKEQLYTEQWISDLDITGARTYLSSMWQGFYPSNTIGMNVMQVVFHRVANSVSLSPDFGEFIPHTDVVETYLHEDNGLFFHNKYKAMDKSLLTYATLPASSISTLEEVLDEDLDGYLDNPIQDFTTSSTANGWYGTGDSWNFYNYNDSNMLQIRLNPGNNSGGYNNVWDYYNRISDCDEWWKIHNYIRKNLGSISEEVEVEFIYIPNSKMLFDMYKYWYSSTSDITAQSIAGYTINGINRDLNEIKSWSDTSSIYDQPGAMFPGQIFNYYENFFNHFWGTPLDIQIHLQEYNYNGQTHDNLAHYVNEYDTYVHNGTMQDNHENNIHYYNEEFSSIATSNYTPGYIFQIAKNMTDSVGGWFQSEARSQFICFGLDYQGNQISGYNSNGVSNVSNAGGINTGDGSMEANIEFWDLLAFNGIRYEDLPRFKIVGHNRLEFLDIWDPLPLGMDQWRVDCYRDTFQVLWSGVDVESIQNDIWDMAQSNNWNAIASSNVHYNGQYQPEAFFPHQIEPVEGGLSRNWNYYFSNGFHIHFKEDWNVPGTTGIKVPKGGMFPLVMPEPKVFDSVIDDDFVWRDAKLTGLEPNVNYSEPVAFNQNMVTLEHFGVDNANNQHIGILFTLPESEVEDAIEESGFTYFHGKIDMVVDPNETTNLGINAEYLNFRMLGYLADVEAGEEMETLSFGMLAQARTDDLVTANGELLSLFDNNHEHFGTGGFGEEYPVYMNAVRNYLWDIPNRFNALVLDLHTNSHLAYTGKTSLSTRIHHLSVKHVFEVGNIINKEFYIDSLGRTNDYLNESPSPTSIIRNIIEEELETPVELHDSFYETESLISNLGWKMAFSVTKKMNSKKLIEDIAKNSPIIPLFRSNAKLGMAIIQKEYAENDVDVPILSEHIQKISFDRTKVEKVKTMVRVKHSKDYADDSYEFTKYVDAYDFYGNGDKGYPNGYKKENFALNPDSPGDSVMEFESNYTRNPSDYTPNPYFNNTTPTKLRDFILAYNCNQHNIINVTLPLRYMHIEITDIVSFDSLANNMKCFGEDYTVENIRNGQIIHPYFMVTKITKGTKNIQIECMQMHNLNRNPDVLNQASGDFYRSGQVDMYDREALDKYIINPTQYLTEGQFYNCDLNMDEVIDENDLSLLTEQLVAQGLMTPELDVELVDWVAAPFVNHTGDSYQGAGNLQITGIQTLNWVGASNETTSLPHHNLIYRILPVGSQFNVGDRFRITFIVSNFEWYEEGNYTYQRDEVRLVMRDDNWDLIFPAFGNEGVYHDRDKGLTSTTTYDWTVGELETDIFSSGSNVTIRCGVNCRFDLALSIRKINW